MRRCSALLTVRLISSGRADGLRGARSLLTPEERERHGRDTETAPQRAAAYQRLQQPRQQQADEATARILQQQAARRAQFAEDRADDSGALPVSSSILDAKFAQMERAGEFSNLSGVGKPLPDRPATHFGGEDAMDRMLERIMAEHNVKPESVERRNSYMDLLQSFRDGMARSADVLGEGGGRKPLHRATVTAALQQLASALKAHDDAAIKDSFTYNLPIQKLPTVGSLEEEIARAKQLTGGGRRR